MQSLCTSLVQILSINLHFVFFSLKTSLKFKTCLLVSLIKFIFLTPLANCFNIQTILHSRIFIFVFVFRLSLSYSVLTSTNICLLHNAASASLHKCALESEESERRCVHSNPSLSLFPITTSQFIIV